MPASTPPPNRSLAQQLRDAKRDAAVGVARVAGSFASDLAEALEAARVLDGAIERHITSHGDPDGTLAAARAQARRSVERAQRTGR